MASSLASQFNLIFIRPRLKGSSTMTLTNVVLGSGNLQFIFYHRPIAHCDGHSVHPNSQRSSLIMCLKYDSTIIILLTDPFNLVFFGRYVDLNHDTSWRINIGASWHAIIFWLFIELCISSYLHFIHTHQHGRLQQIVCIGIPIVKRTLESSRS